MRRPGKGSRSARSASGRRRARVAFGVFALLTAMTWALGLSGVRYLAGPPLAFADGFPGAEDAWLRHGEPANIALDATSVTVGRGIDAPSYAKRLVPLPGADEALRRVHVRGTVETVRRPTPGVPNDDKARLMLFLLGDDLEAKPVRYRTVERLGGESPLLDVDVVLGLEPGERAAYLVLMNQGSDGVFRLSDVRLDLLTTDPAWRVSALALLVGWAALGLAVARAAAMRLGPIATLWLGVPAGLIVVGVLLPERLSMLPLAGGALEALVARLQGLEEAGLPSLFKLGHFAFFAASAGVACVLRARLGLSATALAASFVVFALATEGLQLHLPERTTRLSDIGLDLAGAALGALVVAGWRAVRDRRVAAAAPAGPA